jgi:Tol biopolymer transport system component
MNPRHISVFLLCTLFGFVALASATGRASQQEQAHVVFLPAANAPVTSRIVFSSRCYASVNSDIWLARFDLLTGASNLTNSPHCEAEPDWSPDGSRIVFTVIRAHHENPVPLGIYVMNSDGSERRFLTEGSKPAWSPTGSSIAFVRGGQIYLYDLEAMESVALTEAEAGWEADNPAWSPDALYIAFDAVGGDSGDSERSQVFLLNVDSQEVSQVTREEGSFGYPTFSPDGRRLAVSSGDGIWLTNIDGTWLIRVALVVPPTLGTRSEMSELAWSPDASMILFTEATDWHGSPLYHLNILHLDEEELYPREHWTYGRSADWLASPAPDNQ